jgi:hypothetical protein
MEAGVSSRKILIVCAYQKRDYSSSPKKREGKGFKILEYDLQNVCFFLYFVHTTSDGSAL